MTAQPKVAGEREATGPFVVNLCASTTPMALAHPEAPELKRFNFFVSRRREEGRERFRLHMGYFMTLAEAEEWLNVVRDIYPGAWAGEAPGKNLAQRVAAVVAPRVPVAEAVAPEAVVPEAIAREVVAPQAVAVTPASAVPPIVPTLHAPAAVVERAPPVPVAAPPAAKAPEAKPVAPAPATQSAPRPAPSKAEVPAKAAVTNPKPAKATAPASNVREVLKSLDDSGHTRLMPASVAAAPAAPAPARAPVAPAPAPVAARAPEAPRTAAGAPTREAAALSDTAVLRILENRRTEPTTRAVEAASSGIALLRPDDTTTRRALKEAVQENAPVSFAVQLQWSVQPVELAKVPPLAIFSAYTLYTVEGSRDGRKWFGLRLGFFGDAISAKQVASYVRSEFTSVAVIPVSSQERGRATQNDPTAVASVARPRKEAEASADEFKLLDDRTDEVEARALAAVQTRMQAAKPASAAKPAARRKALGRVRASEKRPSKTLEETLEILGASSLEIDNGRGELINDSGVRHLRVEAQKNSPFSRLLVRLSERVRKS